MNDDDNTRAPPAPDPSGRMWRSIYSAPSEAGANLLVSTTCSAWLAHRPGRQARARLTEDGRWVVEASEPEWVVR